MNRFFQILFMSLIMTVFLDAKGQCPESENKCVPDLSKYTLLKSFEIDLPKVKNKKMRPPTQRFSIMLSKGTRYIIQGCANRAISYKPMVMNLYDNFGLVATSYNKSTGKYYPGFQYICNKSGIYYVTFYFVDGIQGCGTATISMKKTTTN